MKPLLIALMLMLTTQMTAISQNNSYLSENLFVDQIITNEEGVFLNLNGNWIATDGMQATPNGIFVLVEGNWLTVGEALETPKCWRKKWKCSKCGFWNYEGISACGVCGKPRKG